MSKFIRAFSLVFLVGNSVSAAPVKVPVVLPEAPQPVHLHAPATLTITSGEITLEGGSLAIGPDGKTYQGGTMKVENGSIVFDPVPQKPSKP